MDGIAREAESQNELDEKYHKNIYDSEMKRNYDTLWYMDAILSSW